MRKSFLALILGGFCALAALSSCQPEQQGSITSVSLGEINADLLTAEVSLTTKGLTEYAYLVSAAGEELSDDPVVIFATGTTGTLVDGENKIVVRDLIPQTEQQIVVAFKTSETEFYPQVLTASFTTTDYTDTFTLVKSSYDGFTFHFMVPRSVKDAGNAIRYSVASLPMYLFYKTGNRSYLDADMLLENGQRHMLGDTTLVYDDSTIYELDENGNRVVDDLTGDDVMIHTPFSPGEPIVVMAGEFSWDDSDIYGWGSGYYNALFDYDTYKKEEVGGGVRPWSVDVDTPSDEDKYWTGYFFKKNIVLPQPEDFDAKLDIQYDVQAVSGTITITPGDNVPMFCYLIIPDEEFELDLEVLDNNEDYLQWYVTSYFAYITRGANYSSDALQIILEKDYYLEANQKYHLLITAFGNEKGTVQHFFHETFTTTEKTEPAPEIVVTALEDKTTPYNVVFNVKCPSKNAVSAKYVANYVSEFEIMLKKGNSYNAIAGWGSSFTAEEILQINSDAGLDVSFSSVPNSTTRLAVLAFNSEKTSNEIVAGGSAVADGTSKKEVPQEKVDSPLFSELIGDWTATASVIQSRYGYDEDGNYGLITDELGQRSRKISISAGYTYPDVLPESVYKLYKNKTREEVDALYDEFKQTVDEFNAALVGQNRLLCTGFGYETEFTNNNQTYFTENSAYDLFISETYSGYDVESILWDCGPKFYLEIKPDGSVVLPINSSRFYPMSHYLYFNTKNSIYPVGIGKDRYLGKDGYLSYGPEEQNADFPVSVSDDHNTLTIGQYEYNDTPYYLNALYIRNGYAYVCGAQIVSDIVLTKGWAETQVPAATVKTSAAASENHLKIEAVDGMNATQVATHKSKTAFKTDRQMKKVVYKPVSLKEKLEENRKSYEVR